MGECLLISLDQASLKDLLVPLPLQAPAEGHGTVEDLMKLGTCRDWWTY